jgi:hypothetical protein
MLATSRLWIVGSGAFTGFSLRDGVRRLALVVMTRRHLE